MSMLQQPGGPNVPDLALTAEIKRDREAQERMTALQMVLDMHSRGIPVIQPIHVGPAEDAKPLAPKAALAAVYTATKKWQEYIFSGQAIGS